MNRISLDHTRMLGFRLLNSEETSRETVAIGGKSGKSLTGETAQDVLCEAMATSAKFGKAGKNVNIDDAMAASSKFGKVGKVLN